MKWRAYAGGTIEVGSWLADGLNFMLPIHGSLSPPPFPVSSVRRTNARCLGIMTSDLNRRHLHLNDWDGLAYPTTELAI
jgi:hypothetical protein